MRALALKCPARCSKQNSCLIHRQRTNNAADHFTWETCRFPPAAVRWGHRGEEHYRLTNHTVKNGAVERMPSAAGHPPRSAGAGAAVVVAAGRTRHRRVGRPSSLSIRHNTVFLVILDAPADQAAGRAACGVLFYLT